MVIIVRRIFRTINQYTVKICHTMVHFVGQFIKQLIYCFKVFDFLLFAGNYSYLFLRRGQKLCKTSPRVYCYNPSASYSNIHPRTLRGYEYKNLLRAILHQRSLLSHVQCSQFRCCLAKAEVNVWHRCN